VAAPKQRNPRGAKSAIRRPWANPRTSPQSPAPNIFPILALTKLLSLKSRPYKTQKPAGSRKERAFLKFWQSRPGKLKGSFVKSPPRRTKSWMVSAASVRILDAKLFFKKPMTSFARCRGLSAPRFVRMKGTRLNDACLLPHQGAQQRSSNAICEWSLIISILISGCSGPFNALSNNHLRQIGLQFGKTSRRPRGRPRPECAPPIAIGVRKGNTLQHDLLTLGENPPTSRVTASPWPPFTCSVRGRSHSRASGLANTTQALEQFHSITHAPRRDLRQNLTAFDRRSVSRHRGRNESPVATAFTRDPA